MCLFMKAERLQQQQKHENQMRDMVAQCESNMNELQQLQVLSPVPPFPQGSQCSEAKGSPVGLIRVDQAQAS